MQEIYIPEDYFKQAKFGKVDLRKEKELEKENWLKSR